MGVRNSWLMLARNWLLATLADCASAARCSKRLHQADPLHGDRHLVGNGADQPQSSSENVSRVMEPNERVPITRPWFSKRAAGVSPDAELADQLRAGLDRGLDVLGRHARGIASRAAADFRAVFEPLDLAGGLRRDAFGGVQPQLVLLLVHQVVEEHLAVEMFHHPPAERIDDLLRPIAGQQLAADLGEQFQPLDGPPHGLLGALQLRDVVEGDHHALDAVVAGAVGKRPAHEPPPVLRLHLLILGHELLQHLLAVGQQVGHAELGGDVLDRAAHVRGDQVEQLDGRGRELPDVEGGVEEQRGDVGAGQQVVEVVGGGLQLRHLLFKLVVERRQFLVERLQLFLRGLQFLVARLELLVHRHGFFVRSLEFLVRAFQLFDRAVEFQPRFLEFPLQLPDVLLLGRGGTRSARGPVPGPRSRPGTTPGTDLPRSRAR